MSGLDNMKKRITFAGGDADGKLVKGKLKSFYAALNNSYQAEWITFGKKKFRCLINPDKLKEDYDQKVISVDFASKMKEGDTFFWDRTNTYWITYLQEYAEEAYFRAQIRRCNYQIEIEGTKYWVYLRGPVETDLIWRQKHNIEFNELNYSLILYISKNEQTLSFFNRIKVLKFDGHNWRVNATDKYSQRNIIEVNLGEHFDNSMEDAAVIPEIIEPDKALPYIEGPQFIDAYSELNEYSIVNATEGTFVVNSNKVEIESSDTNTCSINVLTGRSASFELLYQRDEEEDIVLVVNIDSF